MPRVNWYLSSEAKTIFEAYKSETGLGQDEAAVAMILEFGELRKPLSGLVGRDASGNIIKMRGLP